MAAIGGYALHRRWSKSTDVPEGDGQRHAPTFAMIENPMHQSSSSTDTPATYEDPILLPLRDRVGIVFVDAERYVAVNVESGAVIAGAASPAGATHPPRQESLDGEGSALAVGAADQTPGARQPQYRLFLPRDTTDGKTGPV